MGQARPDLPLGMRSSTHDNYVILFRYVGSRFEVVNVIEGHRDIPTYFSEKIEP